MKISSAVCAISVVAILVIASSCCSAQDKPLGDVAREARAQKPEADHAKKVFTNDDLSPQLVPVQETDDPVKVVSEAWRVFLADAGHTCHGELTNNSGPGSLETSLIEAQGQDRTWTEAFFQPTLQPTDCDVLYDFRVLWQSPRSSKLL